MFSFLTDTLWKYIALALGTLLVSLCVYVFFIRSELASLREDNAILNGNIEKYNQAIAQAEDNQKTKIEYVDREVKVIEYRTKEKLIPVKEYVYDTNKTDCQNAINVLRASGF